LDELPIGATCTVATFGQLRLLLALLTYLADLGGDNLKNLLRQTVAEEINIEHLPNMLQLVVQTIYKP
jgi:hypothetical protein